MTITKRQRFYMLNALVYFIAYYYVFFAAINDGITGYVLGIPYALFLLYDIKHLHQQSTQRYQWIKVSHILMLIVAVILINSDRSGMSIVYPAVGKTISLKKGAVVIPTFYSGYYTNNIKFISPVSMNEYRDRKKFHLKKGSNVKINKQIVIGHSDLTTDYIYEVESPIFKPLKEYIMKHRATLEKKSTEGERSYTLNKPVYFGDKNRFYIDEYDLRDYFDINYPNYDNWWNKFYYTTRICSFTIFICAPQVFGSEANIVNFMFYYPLVLLIFWFLVIYRNIKSRVL